ncbi:DUF443 domain-containing protein [Cerasibacillus terrae]|uniref:DUF443 domain-containing protein n=1 Tax=Cerasibacillus terrae TaxID=2498845 RepID=A0A5C8NZL0_9BACI|nr:DUF443 domain-containing protein [Cerasibacillus terrae]
MWWDRCNKSNELGVVIELECEAEHVFKNIRYKIIRVKDDYYILDMDQSIWTIIFPFLFWFIPHTVYKINRNTFEELKMPLKYQGGRGGFILLGTGISLILAQFIQPLLNGIMFQASMFVNVFIIIFSLILCIFYRIRVHHTRHKKMNEVIAMKKLEQEVIKIRPKLLKHYVMLIFFFLFTLAFIIPSMISFIQMGHIIPMLGFIAATAMFFILNTMAIFPGPAKVKFVMNKTEINAVK